MSRNFIAELDSFIGLGHKYGNNVRGVVVGRSAAHWRLAFEDAVQHCPDAARNHADAKLTFASGAELLFRSCGNNGIEHLRGRQFSRVILLYDAGKDTRHNLLALLRSHVVPEDERLMAETYL